MGLSDQEGRDTLEEAKPFLHLQVVLSWRAGGRIHRQVVTRELELTTVLASYCRDMDVQIAAVLLAKGVLQDLPSAADHDELAATRDSIGVRTPCTMPPVTCCICSSPQAMLGHTHPTLLQSHVSGSYCVDFQGVLACLV